MMQRTTENLQRHECHYARSHALVALVSIHANIVIFIAGNILYASSFQCIYYLHPPNCPRMDMILSSVVINPSW